MSKTKSRKSRNSASATPNHETPSTQCDDVTRHRDVYEPIIDLAADSPLRVQGNLTGIPRRLKDLTADWYNENIKWKRTCHAGFQICNKIANIKMDSFVDGEALPQSLLPPCDELLSVIDSLQHSYNKMLRWDEAMSGISELISSQNKTSHVIFQTWTIEGFRETSHALLNMYKSELTLKQNIYENICHSENKSELTFMLACWAHDPYMDNSTLLKLDAMVAETGHER